MARRLRGLTVGSWRIWGATVALPIVLSGCSYITQSTFETKKNNLDQDGDKSVFADDCDDLDEMMTPGADEIPYDGIDNDCGSDGDQVDVDSDGFPGISREDYEAMDPPPKEPYPTRFENKPLDCVDDPAIRPEAAQIFPDLDPDPDDSGEEGERFNNNEVPYDGIDSNCDGANDFDDDLDGFMPDYELVDGLLVDVAAAYADYVTSWDYGDREAEWGAPAGTATPQGGDCNDFDALVNPGSVVEDAWYDGVDQNCDDLNDFDQDGDGWMPELLPDGSATEQAYNQFVAEYHSGEAPWPLPADVIAYDGAVLTAFSDCLDAENPAITDPGTGGVIDPATVYPQVPGIDTPYDGVDSDCNRDNDFDQDSDAFMPDTLMGGGDIVALYSAYVTSWGYEALEAVWGDINPVLTLTAPEYGDCDDNSALTYPAALESLSDPADQDCDGDPSGSSFAFSVYEWGRPSGPAVDRVGDYYAISATSEWADINGPLEHVGVTMFFHVDEATSMAEPTTTPLQWKANNPGLPVADIVDMVVDDTVVDLDYDGELDPGYWVTTTYSAANNYTYLMAAPVYWNSPTQKFLLTGSTVYNWIVNPGYDATDLEIELDADDEPYILACADDIAHVVRGSGMPPTLATSDQTVGLGGVCFFDDEAYTQGSSERIDFTRCNGTQCQSMTIDDDAVLQISAGPTTGELWEAGSYRDGVQALRDSNGLVIRDLVGGVDYPAFTGMNVTAHDATVHDGELFALAVVEDLGTPRVMLEYGVFPSTEVTLLNFVNEALPDVEPVDVGIFVDDDRIAIAVMGRDRFGSTNLDTIGWVFLGH